MGRSSHYVGWDVGGAHLKLALVNASGELMEVRQVPCPLWRGIATLDKACAVALSLLPSLGCRHAVTMTGELCDIFLDRGQGVQMLTCKLLEVLGEKTLFYAGEGGFIGGGETYGMAAKVASANWRATAEYVAQRERNCMLLDIGSTTTDIVLIREGQTLSSGSTDAERLAAQELVYTGVVRTPIMAVTTQAPLHGRWYPMIAERFATMGDVYRLTGELHDRVLQHHVHFDAADGGGADPGACARRLARMLGCDLDDAAVGAWPAVARFIRERQLSILFDAISRVMSKTGVEAPPRFLGAGVGRYLAAELAQRFKTEYRDIEACFAGPDALREFAAVCAPATALAYLIRSHDA